MALHAVEGSFVAGTITEERFFGPMACFYTQRGRLRWNSAHPPVSEDLDALDLPTAFLSKYQAASLTVEDTKGWFHRAMCDELYSNMHDFRLLPHTNKFTPGPPNMVKGEENPDWGARYEPLIGDRDHDGAIPMSKQGRPESVYGLDNPTPIRT